MKVSPEMEKRVLAVVMLTVLVLVGLGAWKLPVHDYDGKRDRAEVLMDADQQAALQECQRAYARQFEGVPPGTQREHEDCHSALLNARDASR